MVYVYIVKSNGVSSERRGRERRGRNIVLSDKSVTESVACHEKCVVNHGNAPFCRYYDRQPVPQFLWHATLATPFSELPGIDALRIANVVSVPVYFLK